MDTPNSSTKKPDINSAVSELSLSHSYYQHKANECRDLIESLIDWNTVPDSLLDFSVAGRSVASFKIGPAENEFLQTVLMSLMAYYTRKAAEARNAVNDISQDGSPGPDSPDFS